MDKNRLHEAINSNDPVTAVRNIYQDYPTLYNMEGFDQENPHHSMNLLDHSLETLNNASMYSEKPEVRMAALYHDSGKPDTKEFNPEKGHHTYHGHEEEGANIARQELLAMGHDPEFVDDVSLLIGNHMRPLGYANQPFGDKGVRRLVRKSQGNNVNIDDLMHLNRADILAHEGSSAESTMEGHYKLQDHINKVRDYA